MAHPLDPDCVFCKIVAGTIPCFRLAEDARALAFLDIMSRTEGHALVITKEKARDLFDIKPEALQKYGRPFPLFNYFTDIVEGYERVVLK